MATFADEGLAIRTEGLTRRYGDVVALDRLDLRVPNGAIFGFLGRNGAGKTTTMRLLTGLARPTAGSAWLAGRADRAVPGGSAGRDRASGALVPGQTKAPFQQEGRFYGGRDRTRTYDLTDVNRAL